MEKMNAWVFGKKQTLETFWDFRKFLGLLNIFPLQKGSWKEPSFKLVWSVLRNELEADTDMFWISQHGVNKSFLSWLIQRGKSLITASAQTCPRCLHQHQRRWKQKHRFYKPVFKACLNHGPVDHTGNICGVPACRVIIDTERVESVYALGENQNRGNSREFRPANSVGFPNHTGEIWVIFAGVVGISFPFWALVCP